MEKHIIDEIYSEWNRDGGITTKEAFVKVWNAAMDAAAESAEAA